MPKLHRTLINGARGVTATFLVYPLTERFEGRHVRSNLRAFESEMARPFAERQLRSWAAVVDTVRHAAINVPYYRDLFARIGFNPEKLLADPHYLQDIPYLSKDIIRAEGDRMLRHDHATARKHVSKTGGSTGPAAVIVYDQEAADYSSAVTRYLRRTIGKRKFHSELHFASKFPDEFPLRDRLRERAKCFAMNRHNVFFTSFDPDELEAIWRRIERVQPYLVHGHPSTMYQLALHVAARPGPRDAFLVFESSGELFANHQRDTIARVFRCDIVDRYGLAEIGIAAYQAGLHDLAMVVVDPVAWPEIVETDSADAFSPPHEGRFGELVLTATKNRMMPLIRYRTGDMAVLSETPRGFILDKLVGRTHDIVEIGGHRLPTHYIQDLLNRIGGINEFQIERGGEQLVLRIVSDDDANIDEIRDRIGRYWQGAIDVEFIAASELRLLGGRLKFCRIVPHQTAPQDSPFRQND